MLDKLNQFVGRAHSPDFDCADLAIAVAREIFGREIALPTVRPRPLGARGQALALRVAMGELARPVPEPSDGDLVLMQLRGSDLPGHVGTYFHVAHEAHVLHTSLALGYAGLHKLRDLPRYGITFKGFYRWID